MQTNKQPIGGGSFLKKQLQSAPALLCLLLTIPMFCATNAFAYDLIWDAGSGGTDTTGATVPSSGIWDTNQLNLSWFGTNAGVAANYAWHQQDAGDGASGAIFNGPNAAPGTYQILLDTNQIAWTNFTINANGYLFYGPMSFYADAGALTVADGVSVTISNTITGNNNKFMPVYLGTGPTPAELTLIGNPGVGSGLAFSSTNGSTLILANNSGTTYANQAGLVINCYCIITNGTYAIQGSGTSSLNVGRSVGTITEGNGTKPPIPSNNGTLILDGPNTVFNFGTTAHSAAFGIGAGTGQGTLILRNGATVNAGVNSAGGAGSSGTASSTTFSGTVDIFGGAFNIGNETTGGSGNSYSIMTGGCSPGATFTYYQTGGVFSAYAGIVIGGPSGSFSGGYVGITNAGGIMNIGPAGNNGISLQPVHPATVYVTFSGGTVTTWGGSWSTAVPITLATTGGNITFQCADTANGNSYNIGLAGALSGPGGFNKTGGGVLTLSANNTYTGSTVVSNGTLVIETATASVNGPVVVDASAGNPILSTVVGAAGQSWSIGNLTYQFGTPTADFNFGTVQPSTTVAPIQVAGNVAFTATPNVTIEANATPNGTYPLIKYTGTVSGIVPSSATINLPGASATLVNNVSTKTISLVVTGSPVNAPIKWAVGNGNWDTGSANWLSNSLSVKYGDPDSVVFDDSASGTSPITVSVATTVDPGSVAAINNTKNYIITDTTGVIAGSGPTPLSVSGSGSLTLVGNNTYSSGTVVTGPGQLNINSGGDSTGNDSAIGTGPLTINPGATLDNTSGQAVSLVPYIPETWNGSWTNTGSSSLGTGDGQVTLNANVVNLTVVSNTLNIQGSINDNGQNDQIQKFGNGALTLSVGNGFGGGLTLWAGTLNIGDPGAIGTGSLVINGGSIDNISGGLIELASGFPAPIYYWNGSFSFIGTTSLDLGLSEISASAVTVNVISNTLTTEGDVVSGNLTLTKIGAGDWNIVGYGTANQNSLMSLVVDQGEVDLNRAGGFAIGAGGAGANPNVPGSTGHGLTVESNSLVVVVGSVNQIWNNFGGKYVPLVMNSGGAFDLDGEAQTVDVVSMNNGILRNGMSTSVGTLNPSVETIFTNNWLTLAGGNNYFDVPSPDSTLTIGGVISGTGNLIQTGFGTVTLLSSNNYQGNITISNGTLSLSFPDMAKTATVTIMNDPAASTNGVLNLNFANPATNIVAALVLGGVSQPAGLYSAANKPQYLSGSGTLLVVPPVINPVGGPIQFSLAGNTLALSWPTNAGWILQSQTNSLSTGLGTNWVAVPGSTSVTSTNMTINPANGSVYFRLAHP